MTYSLPPDPTVFISYAHGDADFANQLIADLRANGYACWIDSDIEPGDKWLDRIAEVIRNSDAFIVILTPKALDSDSVRNEIGLARDLKKLNDKKLIIPLMLENVLADPRFSLLLGGYQVAAFFNSDYEKTALPKLLHKLSNLGPRHAPRELELKYLQLLKDEQLLHSERYTPLGGGSQQRRRPEMRQIFTRVATGKDRHLRDQPQVHSFVDAVEEIRHRLPRAVLLGEPGGGKTTTLGKLAADLVETALQDAQAPIPLLIRLGFWTEARQPLRDFIATELRELGAYLDVLLDQNRAALLLDGLNELPVGQRALKYPQVEAFIKQHQHPQLLAVVSCRELDYQEIDLGFDRIVIMPLDPIRIGEFAGHYLGEEQGEALFWKLAEPAAKHEHERFMQKFAGKLPEPEQVFWVEPQLPEGFRWGWGENDNSYWQSWLKLRETPSSLMVLARNPYMLSMLTDVFDNRGELPKNRGELFQEFVEILLERERKRLPETEQEALREEQEKLTDELARVAYEMQMRRAQDDKGDALTVLPKETVKSVLDERQLYLAGSASLLSLGEHVRFTHQLLQEYFAARYMQIKMNAGKLDASDLWPPDRWWERTNWEEAAILLAGLYSDDCSPVVKWLAEANPEVAAQCIMRSGADLAPATRDATCEQLRRIWIPRLTDLTRDPNPKARAAVGRALGLTGLDNRPGVGITDKGLPDFDLVEIPGGEFQYGDKSESDNPPPKLTLPTFHISRYPVTCAQFQTFLDDPEGYADPRWFDGLAADDDDRPMREQYFKFANHPRETVNWYQAMAFCRWFSWRRGSTYDLKKVGEWAVRLPTEYEWEKAARGASRRKVVRLYPYEGDFDAAKGNTYETGIGQTSAVGIFPNGASPYRVMDMSGNVWEWCLSSYDKPALDARKESLRTTKSRVLRGGSWNGVQGFARAVYRGDTLPALRDSSFGLVGFRVVVVVRPPSP
ncbi:MAG TPA: SUMF1/EgtB/PvdO family nonheme iron enzyme [Blastocatellia bacterium]|nr:SUMF1/EgtB/PvdO family nonheme iron enzyme [Blastocatellia bacterium]